MGLFDALFGWLSKPKPVAKTVTVTNTAERDQQDFTPADLEADAVLSVLVAEMEGAGGTDLSESIAGSFSSLPGVKAQRLNQALSIPAGSPLINGLDMVTEQGRDFLYQYKADVLIWGGVVDQESTVSIRFISSKPAPEGRPGAVGPSDQLEIPTQYPPELEDVVIACALTAVAPTLPKSRTDIGSLLHDYAAQVKLLIDYGSSNLSEVQKFSVLSSIANVMAMDAMINSGGKGLEGVAELYRKVIARMPPDLDGSKQAIVQSHLADTLQVMSTADDTDTELTGQVVACYQAATEALDEAVQPHDWAQAHVRLGLALYRHAIRSGKAKLMKESIQAMKQSLKVYSKQAIPGKWAEVMNHSGVIMTAMGEEVNNDAILQQALKVFGETLEMRKREVAPMLWAQTTNNMAAAAFALAKRKKDKALMDKAAMAFEGAADVYREAGHAKRVNVIEKNLNRVQRRLEIM